MTKEMANKNTFLAMVCNPDVPMEANPPRMYEIPAKIAGIFSNDKLSWGRKPALDKTLKAIMTMQPLINRMIPMSAK